MITPKEALAIFDQMIERADTVLHEDLIALRSFLTGLDQGATDASGEKEARDEEAYLDKWSDFEDEGLCNGNDGYAPASTYKACRSAFDKGWKTSPTLATEMARAAFKKLHPKAAPNAAVSTVKENVTVAPGWRLVPIDPTPEMWDAGKDCNALGLATITYPIGVHFDATGVAIDVYRAMIAAAPTVEQSSVVSDTQGEVEPVAWLKTWKDGDLNCKRVDQHEDCQVWLQAFNPTVTPLFAHPPINGMEEK